MTTVKQIHNSFYKEVCEPMTKSQQEALEKVGIELNPPDGISKAFPFHKIIHLNRILSLCEKYNLDFKPTNNFTGFIPQKNIQELENFVMKYDYIHLRNRKFKMGWFWGDLKDVSKSHLFIKRKDIGLFKYNGAESVYHWYIVAPKQMLPNKEQFLSNEANSKTGETLLFTDPIIIGMVQGTFGCGAMRYGNIKWGVIVTAWGDEASDEAVVNEKMN